MNKKIKELREKRYPGRGGAALCAEEFGVAPQYWSNWESGEKTPGARNQQKLAEFFGISLAELRGEKQKAPDFKPGVGGDAKVAAALKGSSLIRDFLDTAQELYLSGELSVDDYLGAVQSLLVASQSHRKAFQRGRADRSGS